jgi:small subunit ribosomal protein S1
MVVMGFNRGGVLVSGAGLQGFVPISHLVEVPCQESDTEIWLEKFVDRTLDLKVIECDQDRGRVVFSERAARALPGSRKRLLERLVPGDCLYGTVTNITEFGIFVDLGGVEGLVHVSEISWGRVHHPGDVVHLGDEVEVYVIQVDKERARIALSLKRLRPNPWETAEQRYHAGQITEAIITSVVPFGAFARLGEDLEGLIHVSEMSEQRIAHPKEVLHEGEVVTLRVIKIDPERRRIGLSLRMVDSPAYADLDWKMALADEVVKVHAVEEAPAEDKVEEPVAEEETPVDVAEETESQVMDQQASE